MRVSLLDVSLASDNAGDHVITHAVDAAVAPLLPEGWWSRVPTHRRPRLREIAKLWESDIVVLGGSNILSSHLENHHQWRLWPDLMLAIRNKVVLCGVGWNRYDSSISAASRSAIRWMAKRDAIHSARDEYTTSKLRSLGLRVVNTGCPTTWSLQDVPPRPAPADGAIVTVTDYRKNHKLDRTWLESMVREFEQVRLVPMGESDAAYARELAVPGVKIARHGLDSLDEILEGDVIHVGTRLHAGIRCLQRGAPSVVFAVDNRATEIARDIGLPVAHREDPSFLGRLDWNAPISLNLPVRNIQTWTTSIGELCAV